MKRRGFSMLGRALLALALAAGCSGGGRSAGAPEAPPEAKAAPEPNPTRASRAPKARAAAPLEIPPAQGEPAPWLDPRPPGKTDALGVAGEVRWGQRAALVQTRAGWILVHRDRGVLGRVELPTGTAWVGLDAKDRVLAATRGGELRAASPEEALAGGAGFRRRGAVPGAAAWDAAGDVVVAGASWDEVFVSRDGGRRFDKASVGEGLQVIEVRARADGAVVARARSLTDPDAPLTAFTASGGRKLRFRRALFQPEEQLFRTGAWIWARPDCPAVLAADGLHWISRDVYALADQNLWADMLDRAYEVRALPPTDLLSALAPRAPRYERRRDGSGDGSCRESDPVEGGAEGGLLGQLAGMGCKDLDCLQRSWPHAAGYRSMLALRSAGRCARPADAGADGWCGPGAKLSRNPHAVRRDAARPIELPEDCAPVRVLAGPGLPLLLCARDTGTRIYSLDESDVWHREADLPAAPGSLRTLQAAEDGTLLLGVACARAPKPCRVFCRAPRGAGAADLWREVRAESALAYRVVSGGRVLSFARASGTRVRVALHAPGAAPAPLAEAAALPPDASGIQIEDRQIHIVSGSLLEPLRHALGQDGSLIPVASRSEAAPRRRLE